MLLVGCQEGHLVRKNLSDEVLAWLFSGAKCKQLRTVQLMQLPPSSLLQQNPQWFILQIPTHLGSLKQSVVKRL